MHVLHYPRPSQLEMTYSRLLFSRLMMMMMSCPRVFLAFQFVYHETPYFIDGQVFFRIFTFYILFNDL